MPYESVRVMELGTLQLSLSVIALLWLAAWTAGVWGCGGWENEKGHGQDSEPDCPFPTERADGVAPVHDAGRCCHLTLRAGCKNTQKGRSSIYTILKLPIILYQKMYHLQHLPEYCLIRLCYPTFYLRRDRKKNSAIYLSLFYSWLQCYIDTHTIRYCSSLLL